jgi:hypothetical protein
MRNRARAHHHLLLLSHGLRLPPPVSLNVAGSQPTGSKTRYPGFSPVGATARFFVFAW